MVPFLDSSYSQYGRHHGILYVLVPTKTKFSSEDVFSCGSGTWYPHLMTSISIDDTEPVRKRRCPPRRNERTTTLPPCWVASRSSRRARSWMTNPCVSSENWTVLDSVSLNASLTMASSPGILYVGHPTNNLGKNDDDCLVWDDGVSKFGPKNNLFTNSINLFLCFDIV